MVPRSLADDWIILRNKQANWDGRRSGGQSGRWRDRVIAGRGRQAEGHAQSVPAPAGCCPLIAPRSCLRFHGRFLSYASCVLHILLRRLNWIELHCSTWFMSGRNRAVIVGAYAKCYHQSITISETSRPLHLSFSICFLLYKEMHRSAGKLDWLPCLGFELDPGLFNWTCCTWHFHATLLLTRTGRSIRGGPWSMQGQGQRRPQHRDDENVCVPVLDDLMLPQQA